MRNNKKGFTLVELLAVIVILALIMGIAVVSMSGVLSSSRAKTYQESAAGVAGGLRQRLLIDNLGDSVNGKRYYVTSNILESGGTKSPYGSDFIWADKKIGDALAKCDGKEYCETSDTSGCSATAQAFVEINANGVYKVCLADGTHYVYADESELLDTNATINPAS